MKKIRLIVIRALIMAPIISSGIDFKIGTLPRRPVPTTYTFTKEEEVQALKDAILKKWPNADVSGTNFTLEQSVDLIGTNTLPTIKLTLYHQATVVVPAEKQILHLNWENQLVLTNYLIQQQ